MPDQQDTPNNNSLVSYDGKNFAFPATSSLAVSKGFQTIHRLPETQVNIFDVTQSLEVMIQVSVFNAKLGITKTKDSSGFFNLASTCKTDDYFDASFNYFIKKDGQTQTQTQLDAITLDATEFATAIESKEHVISVGKFSTLYSDFASYVASYFGLTVGTAQAASTGVAALLDDKTSASMSAAAKTQVDGSGVATGFATLFSGAYNWNANGGSFGKQEMYDIIQGKGSADASCNAVQGSITLSNINSIMRYACDSNCFGNRNATTGKTALDPNFRSNYGLTDGFLDGDLIFIPNNGFAITLNLNINYDTQINTYIGNNIGVTNSATNVENLDASGNVVDSDGQAGTAGQTGTNNSNFHATTVTNRNLLSRTVSCPLLIRMVDQV